MNRRLPQKKEEGVSGILVLDLIEGDVIRGAELTIRAGG